MKKYLPNLITSLRILVTPFLLVFLWQDKKAIFLTLLILAAFTDFLDGFVARKLKIISGAGSTFDAFADKVLILSVLIAMLVKGYLNFDSLMILAIRDILVILGTGVVLFRSSNIDVVSSIKHTWAGKLTTFLQFITIIALVFNFGAFYLLTATFVFGLWAGISYIILGVRLSRARKTIRETNL